MICSICALASSLTRCLRITTPASPMFSQTTSWNSATAAPRPDRLLQRDAVAAHGPNWEPMHGSTAPLLLPLILDHRPRLLPWSLPQDRLYLQWSHLHPRNPNPKTPPENPITHRCPKHLSKNPSKPTSNLPQQPPWSDDGEDEDGSAEDPLSVTWSRLFSTSQNPWRSRRLISPLCSEMLRPIRPPRRWRKLHSRGRQRNRRRGGEWEDERKILVIFLKNEAESLSKNWKINWNHVLMVRKDQFAMIWQT